MDDVSRELSRIIKATNREFPSVNWNAEKNPSIGNCNEGTCISELTSTFYFTDRLGVNESHGDTSIHRLFAMHALAPAVETFLDVLREHHLYLDNVTKGILPSVSNTMAVAFDTMPPPPYLDQENYHGVTPLHMVIYRNPWHAETIVRMLLETFNSCRPCRSRGNTNLASVPMVGGAYPLHVLCGHNMTIQKRVLELLLEADPTVVSQEDRRGDNPFSLLWKNVLRFRWAISMERGETTMDCDNDDDDDDDGMTSWITVISPEEFLQYSLMMIGALRACRLDSGTTPGGVCLHEICSIPRCPPLLLRLSLSAKYRSKHGIWGHGNTIDENGMLPLHHAVQSPVATNRFVPPYFDDDGPASVVEILLDEYPDSVYVRDHKGRIPLHCALESGTVSERVIMAMITMYPDSVRLQDPVSGLYPFMLVAAGVQGGRRNGAFGGYHLHGVCIDAETRPKAGWKQDPVRICYNLLQVYPEVISFQS